MKRQRKRRLSAGFSVQLEIRDMGAKKTPKHKYCRNSRTRWHQMASSTSSAEELELQFKFHHIQFMSTTKCNIPTFGETRAL